MAKKTTFAILVTNRGFIPSEFIYRTYEDMKNTIKKTLLNNDKRLY